MISSFSYCNTIIMLLLIQHQVFSSIECSFS